MFDFRSKFSYCVLTYKNRLKILVAAHCRRYRRNANTISRRQTLTVARTENERDPAGLVGSTFSCAGLVTRAAPRLTRFLRARRRIARVLAQSYSKFSHLHSTDARVCVFLVLFTSYLSVFVYPVRRSLRTRQQDLLRVGFGRRSVAVRLTMTDRRTTLLC